MQGKVPTWWGNPECSTELRAISHRSVAVSFHTCAATLYSSTSGSLVRWICRNPSVITIRKEACSYTVLFQSVSLRSAQTISCSVLLVCSMSGQYLGLSSPSHATLSCTSELPQCCRGSASTLSNSSMLSLAFNTAS